MIYSTAQTPHGAEFTPNCPADVYVRMKAAVIAARLATTLSETFKISIEAPKEGVGDWFRANINKAVQSKIVAKESSIELLADFNALRITSKISQFALSKSGLSVESFYLPLSDDHGKSAAGHLQKHLSGLTDFMNAFETHPNETTPDRHYIDRSVDFSSTDVNVATFGNHQQATQVGRLGEGILFLNASGSNGTVHGKELIIVREGLAEERAS